MDPDRWSRIRRLLEELLPLDEAARRARLGARCADDPALRAEVQELLSIDTALPSEDGRDPPSL